MRVVTKGWGPKSTISNIPRYFERRKMEHRTPPPPQKKKKKKKKRRDKERKKERQKEREKEKSCPVSLLLLIPFTLQLEIFVTDLNATSFERSKTLVFNKVHRVL